MDDANNNQIGQEQVEAITSKTADDLQKRLGGDTRVIILVARGTTGRFGYCWSVRGDLFGVMGLLHCAVDSIRTWIMSQLG
jgi:hypothetical protein